MKETLKQYALVKETWVKVKTEVIMENDNEIKLIIEGCKLTINDAQNNYGNKDQTETFVWTTKEN